MNFINLRTQTVDIDYNGQIWPNDTNVTFLGIILDQKINCKDQMDKVYTKLNRYAFALYKLSKVSMAAYFAYIESVLKCCVINKGQRHRL